MKYSQSYDVVCHLALLGSKGLMIFKLVVIILLYSLKFFLENSALAKPSCDLFY